MKNTVEYAYGKLLRGVFATVNPIKKIIIKTYGEAHKFICTEALNILKNEGYAEEYIFYRKYLKSIHEGVVWADQDFKSSNHFYHYEKGTGLYGFSNALVECRKYYNLALGYIDAGDLKLGMFYFGAACHLIQDATVPQHVNNKLLKSHRNFEQWIIRKLAHNLNSFKAENGSVIYNTLKDYIRENALKSNEIYSKYANVTDTDERYNKIATEIIMIAQRTTAGIMLKFYRDVISEK